jgi:diadenosine tetraphosphatase ApaH/serine/threonine PP2A family protein phosphatase
MSPAQCDHRFAASGQRAIVSIGSVGQPRDGDTRASFVTYDGREVAFHRLDYDFKSTMAKIRAVPALPDYLADRLAQGR